MYFHLKIKMFSTFENKSVYKIDDSFTMRNILNIVDKMNIAIPHHVFEPESIREGGICVKGYESGKEYKSIRICFKNWPWLSGGGIKTEDLNRKLIPNDWTGKERLFSNFRCHNGAPEWTKDEMKCIDRIFREEGMRKVRV
ncbi:hypothetical protein FK873_gp213 [Micromonas pusilla virus SP1]|uniref:Uncharacterized protein n=1 Tax=Micromonas pusilla virus SP1 TaxID=373996 RepID=G9E698_MPSP1|nr:hypothetical protein FK873_gp213 [Micromonas pusilla virus SP1]AET84925.1 hypothetical protein MPXG_00127 [Micromonas pusilla virus SP1]